MSKEIYDTGHVLYAAGDLVAAETVTIVADVAVNTISGHAGATVDLGGALTLAAIGTRLEVPRNVILTVTDADASITAGYVTVYGLDASGYPDSETFTLTSAGGTATYTGNKAFAEVGSAIVWGFVGETAADDKVKLGIGNKLGLPMGKDCVLIDVFADHHNAVKIAVNLAGINRTYNTYTSSSAPGAGDHSIELWYTFKRLLNW
jgi:hypothetical protein